MAAVLAAHAIGVIGSDPATLRSIKTNFVAPVTVEPARVTAELLRQGSSVAQVEVCIAQERDGASGVCAVALALFGAARTSAAEITSGLTERVAGPQRARSLAPRRGDPAGVHGEPGVSTVRRADAVTGASNGNMKGHMRFAQPTADFGAKYLVALVDGWVPAPAQMLSGPAMMSTMTWALEFVAPLGDVAPAACW